MTKQLKYTCEWSDRPCRRKAKWVQTFCGITVRLCTRHKAELLASYNMPFRLEEEPKWKAIPTTNL